MSYKVFDLLVVAIRERSMQGKNSTRRFAYVIHPHGMQCAITVTTLTSIKGLVFFVLGEM